jgi:hypothetical protein
MITKFKIFEYQDIDEAIKWYYKGKFDEEEEKKENSLQNFYDNILSHINNDNIWKYNIEVEVDKWKDFCNFLNEHDIRWNSGHRPGNFKPEKYNDKYYIALFYANNGKIRLINCPSNIVEETIKLEE